jgi:hypothetical protein
LLAAVVLAQQVEVPVAAVASAAAVAAETVGHKPLLYSQVALLVLVVVVGLV